MPMSLKTVLNTFLLLMDKVLKDLTFRSLLCYLVYRMDYVDIMSNSCEQHLKEVVRRFESSGLKLNPKKCAFATDKAIFLGHEISKDGPHSDRVDSINNFSIPTNAKELRCALDMLNKVRTVSPD